MTSTEFNTKYKDYIEEGFNGLSIHSNYYEWFMLVDWLDNKFQEFIKRPDFKFSQIKSKFDICTFYAERLTTEEITEIENKITEFLKVWKK